MAAAQQIVQGAIVYADVREPIHLTFVGPHFGVVLNDPAEIEAGLDLRIVVISTSFSNRQPGWYDMDSHPAGHPITGLYEACVAKATWIDVIPQSRIIKIQGRARASTFKQIRNWLREKERQAERAKRESEDGT